MKNIRVRKLLRLYLFREVKFFVTETMLYAIFAYFMFFMAPLHNLSPSFNNPSINFSPDTFGKIFCCEPVTSLRASFKHTRVVQSEANRPSK